MADNNVQRLVGIDFGTSTSLIRVKRYQDGSPIGDSHHTGSVTYGNGAGDSKAVTLVRLNGDRTFTCGRYGEEETPGSTVYREFKMDLENPDPEKQGLARELTQQYFRYLYDRYDHQQSDLGQSGDQVRTLISYPAKWKKETVAFMEEVAADAGFPNISSMDEPSAALYAVLCRKMDDITRQGLLCPGQSGYLLLIDMGAGTTDLALCAYSVSDSESDLSASQRIRTSIVSTYPGDSSSLTFGGREVDRILEDYLIRYLCGCGYTPAMAENVIRGKPNVKTWKEDTVSVLLAQDQQVNTCTLAWQYAMIFGQSTPFPAFGRSQFQQMLGEKLEDFKHLVLGCLDDAAGKEPSLREKGVDLVVLTGGHSSWYFTSELLDGTMPGIDHPLLKKIRREKDRVLRLSNPQETVALGMVYSQLPFRVDRSAAEPVSEEAPSPAAAPDPISAARAAKKTNDFDFSPLSDFLQSSGFRANQRTTGEKLATLKTNLQVPAGAVCFCGYDSTLLSIAKNGTLFTDLGIYSRSTFGNPVFCSWEEFSHGFLRIGIGVILLHNDQTHTELQVGSFANIGEDVLSFYRQLQQVACTVLASGTPTAAEAAEPEPDYTCVDFEALLLQTLHGCNPATLASLTGKSAAALMRQHLNVAPQETVYFAHDDTIFRIGRNGTVLTGSGIYSRSFGNSSVYTSWQDFVRGSVSIENGIIWLHFPDGSGKREIGCFCLSPKAAVELYLELQKAFRAAATGQHAEQSYASSCPVDDFLTAYDWSGLRDLFSPAHIAAVRLEAEPHTGRLLLVHRDYDENDPLRTWFWFALGEKGIYSSLRQFLPWSDFVTVPIIRDRKSDPDSILGETGTDLFQLSGTGCCKLGGTYIPCKNPETAMRLCLFFRELQTYLRDPAAYSRPHHHTEEDISPALRSFADTSPASGIFTPCSNLFDPQLAAFLSLQPDSEPQYFFHSGDLNLPYANGCCIDRLGIHSRHFHSRPTVDTPFSIFLDNGLWAMGRDNWWSFYAGTHFLFGAAGPTDWMSRTLAFLEELQSHLRS